MERKRAECPVLDESAQAHVVTDAKACGADTSIPSVTAQSQSHAQTRPVRRSISNQQARELMERKRAECPVLDENTQAHIGVDSKACDLEIATPDTSAQIQAQTRRKSRSDAEFRALMEMKRD